jgi:hypothetical protein
MCHHGVCPSASFDDVKHPTTVAVAREILPTLTCAVITSFGEFMTHGLNNIMT